MNTYHLTLSGGLRHDQKSTSAGTAMAAAIAKYPGKEIIECYTGCREDHYVPTLKGSVYVPAGWTDFEIPSHQDLITQSAQMNLPLGTAMETVAFDFFAESPVLEKPKKPKKPRGVGIKERTDNL